MKIIILSVLILYYCPVLHSGETLTIEDAIDMALENNESYLNARKELEKAKNRVTEVKASAFPQLSFGFNIMRNWELPTFVIPEIGRIRTGTKNNFIADLTVTQPIYNGGQVFTAWSIAKQYRKFSEFQLEISERQLKLDVINAFWMTVMADELQRVTKQSVKLAEEGLNITKKMEVQGIVSEFDVLMADVRLANLKPKAVEARAAAEISHKALNNIIGLDENEKRDVVFDLDSLLYLMPDPDLAVSKETYVERRPEIKMMKLQTGMMKKAISIAKAGYRPSINFMTSLQYQAQFDANKFPGKNDWVRSSFSAVAISIPIFDSWRTPSRVKQAKLEHVQAKLSEKELEDNIRLEIEQSWWNYQKARENLAAGGQAVEMAKRGLSIARIRFENGVSTQLELFEAEVALAMAETNRIKAFYDLVTGYASLQKALGEDNLLK